MTRNGGECRDCQAPIRWATTNNGKRTLLDFAPSDEEGDVALVTVPNYGEDLELAVALKGEALEKARAGGVPLRTVHFFRCPARASSD